MMVPVYIVLLPVCVYCRVFLGDPPEQPFLGEGALTAKVGQVTTPTSTIVCCVDYRSL